MDHFSFRMRFPRLTPTLAIGLALLVAAPAATAHGAAPSRAIDTRILLDDDGSVGPGGCVDGQCPPNDAGGLDLLSIDGREAYTADGQPTIELRVAFQDFSSKTGQSVKITFKAGGADHEIEFHGGGTAYNSSACAKFAGPIPIGDRTPKAIDCTLLASGLGVKSGDKLEEVKVTSSIGGNAYDVMPGTWYENGQLAPHVPTVEPGQVPDPGEIQEGLSDPELGSYEVVGPAALLNLTTTAPGTIGPFKATLAIQNAVAEDQFATITVQTFGNLTAAVDQSSLDLKASSAARTVILTIDKVKSAGNVTLLITTNLGAYQKITLDVKPPVSVAAPSTATNASSTSSTTKQSPAMELAALGLLLVGLAARRRMK